MRSAQKILLIILLCVFTLFPKTLFAADEQGGAGVKPTTDAPDSVKTGDKAPNPENWDAPKQAIFTGNNLVCWGIAAFVNATPCTKDVPTLTADAKTGEPKIVLRNSRDGGALALVTRAIASVYANPPVSTNTYLAYVWQHSALAPETAYAQDRGVGGSGSGLLQPVLGIWLATRNLAYMFFILIFLATGFMIMFRQKINPQTVISIQAALPGLVIGLIMVTFSYLIAALIMDLLFVLMGVVAQLFIGIKPGGDFYGSKDQVIALSQNPNLFTLYFHSIGGGFLTLMQGVPGLVGGITNTGIPGAVGGAAGIGGLTGAVLGGMTTGLIGLLAGPGLLVIGIPLIIILILIIAFFIQMVKLLIELVKAYLQILILTLAGPFYILFGSLPGRSGVIQNWLKNLFAHALIFPAVFAAFMFSGVLLKSDLPSSTLPFFGGIDGNMLKAILGFGVLLGSSAIPEIIKQAFGIKASPFGQAAIAGAGAGFGVAKAGAGRYIKPYQQARAAIDEQRAKDRASGYLAGTENPFLIDPIGAIKGRINPNIPIIGGWGQRQQDLMAARAAWHRYDQNLAHWQNGGGGAQPQDPQVNPAAYGLPRGMRRPH